MRKLYVGTHIKIMRQWKSTWKPSHWHHHLWQVESFFGHRYHRVVGLFHLNVLTNHLYLLFFRRSTYNHLSSWLTDARNLTNPNTVMSSKCHTSCFFQFMHFEGACQEQDCKALSAKQVFFFRKKRKVYTRLNRIFWAIFTSQWLNVNFVFCI